MWRWADILMRQSSASLFWGLHIPLTGVEEGGLLKQMEQKKSTQKQKILIWFYTLIPGQGKRRRHAVLGHSLIASSFQLIFKFGRTLYAAVLLVFEKCSSRCFSSTNVGGFQYQLVYVFTTAYDYCITSTRRETTSISKRTRQMFV